MMPRVSSQTSFSVGAVFVLALFGCVHVTPNPGPNADAGAGAGVGSPCQSLADCRSGLSCSATAHTCQPAGSTIENAACTLSAECAPGYYCTLAGKCAAAGTGVAGDMCTDSGQCTAGLTCVLQGLTGTCAQAGKGDVSTPCTQTTDCMAGLECLSGICSTPGLTGPWLGATCDAQQSAVAQILFRVPRAGEPASDDFYSLPFPNDIRAPNKKINLTGHPRPGARLLSFDLVDRYLSAIEQDSSGFGVNQAIYFRFSRMPNMGSFTQGAVALLNITPTSPEYGSPSGLNWTVDGNRTPYICDRYITIRPPFGRPLRPGTTYAAIVRRIPTDEAGNVFGPDSDFSAMLADGVPADPDLAAAWQAYAPLRAYLADAKAPTKLTATELAAVAVFTTEKIEDPMNAIQAAIAAAPAPTLSQMVRCSDPGAVSPCDDGLTGDAHTRGCAPASALFDEYQGIISLPVFQQGTPPYLDPPDGGIILAPDGTAPVVRNEPVCISLAVPHGTAPAAGWPLVVYSHGTGGSYRSAVDLGLADDYAQGVVSLGAPVPTATLGYDGILHGTRNGGSTKDVGELVYNFLNPRAARDNALQAAADLLAIPRALGGFATQPKYPITIDPARVALYGHSQGGNAASLALAFQAGYGAGVMSGTGGTLIFTVLEKSQPVNAGVLLPFLLGEPSVGENDPVLNLMQMYFERSDSVNFGRRLFLEPYAGVTRRHALHVYGTNDSYAPVKTQQLYALAAGFSVATPLVDDYPTTPDFGMSLVAPPIKANQNFGGLDLITAAQIQYQPAGYDGHFVSTDNPSARAAIQKFLVTFMRDDAPTIEL